MTLETENQKLQTLQSNLIATLGQISLFEEQRQTIREEITRVQGRIEALTELAAQKKQEEPQPKKPE